jgi:hypothetical protein
MTAWTGQNHPARMMPEHRSLATVVPVDEAGTMSDSRGP